MGYFHKRQRRKPKITSGSQKRVKQKINDLKIGWDKIADRLQKSNQECLIPCRAGEKHDQMNNCHVIGEKFLDFIANSSRGEVLSWPVSVRALGRIAIGLLRDGEYQLNPPYLDIKQYPPFPLAKNDKYLKYTFACKYHDNKAFELADEPLGFNPHEPKTQFALALRSIIAHTALYQGHMRYAKQDFDNDMEIRQILDKHPGLRPIAEIAWDFGTTQTAFGVQLEREIVRWQTACKEVDVSRIVSFATTASPKLRLAGTNIQRRNGHHIIISILPDSQHNCAIIATALAPHNPLAGITRRRCQSAVRDEAEAIKDILENTQPAHWLAQMATRWEFLYVSPEDYKKLPEEDRIKVEECAAQKYIKWLENLPNVDERWLYRSGLTQT